MAGLQGPQYFKNPISEKHLDANRQMPPDLPARATPRGKAGVAQNSRKRGFTPCMFAVVRLEISAITPISKTRLAVYQPANSQELFAIERIALAQPALLFCARLNQTPDSAGEPIVPMSPEFAGGADIEITRNRKLLLGEGFHRMLGESNRGRCSCAIRTSRSAIPPRCRGV